MSWVRVLLVRLAVGSRPPLAASAGTRAAMLLVVTVTKGFRHESIPTAERVLRGLAHRSGAFLVDFARAEADLTAKMTSTALGAYRGVAFVSTTGDLPLPDRERFLAWVARGHGFVGVPATADTFHGYPRYLDMLGREFRRHGPETTVALGEKDPDHPATCGIRPGLSVVDEIQQFQRDDPGRVHLQLALDRHPETGVPGEYPLAWTRHHGRGRVFSTALGHRVDVLEAPWFQTHRLGGIPWALGLGVSGRWAAPHA